MPFRPCPSGCGLYLSPNGRHDRCVHCLGREHADAAFAEEGCQACEDMPLSMIRSRAAFFLKNPRLTSTASRTGPSTSGYKAGVMCVEEERGELSEALPGASPQAARSTCLPMECPNDFESSSQYGLDLLFGLPAEEKACSAASKGECEPSEADTATELTAPVAKSQSVADAEMAAALQRAAKEIGVVWVPPPSPEPSRLDDWFLGSGHDSRPRSSPVPFFPELLQELRSATNYQLLLVSLAKPWKNVPSKWRPSSTSCLGVQRAPAQLRRSSNPRLLRAERGPLREQLRPRKLPVLQLNPSNGPVLVRRWHRQLVLRSQTTLVRLQSVPEMGSPGKEDRLTCPDPYSARGRVLDSAPTRQTATTWSIKEQFPSSLGVTHSTSDPLHDDRMLCCLVRTCGHTPHVLKQRVRSDESSLQGNPLFSSHGTNPPGKAASGLRGFSPPATRHGAPILGMSDVTPLRPLAENFSDWLSLPNPSRWLLRTIRLGYAIQFASHPPKFHGVLATSVQGSNTAVLRAEIAVLLAKDAIETVPSAEIKKGFYSPSGGLRPISDLRGSRLAIDLKDAYFHVSILPRHRPFLRFAFEGRVYQYKVLPFCLSLLPRVFMKVAEAALAPLSEGRGSQPPGSVGTSGQLGKEQTLPSAKDLFSRCGTGLGQYVCASLPRACTVSAVVCGNTQMWVYGPPETSSEAPGAHVILSRGHAAGFDAHETATTLASYPSPEMGMARGTFRVNITPSCRKTLSPWTDIVFLRSGVPLEQVSRRIIVTTDASKTGWGAVCNGQAAYGGWTGPRLHWHINCLELLAVFLALRRFRPLVQGKHVLVRSDNTATVAYINHQSGVRSFHMSQLARHLLLWSQHRLRSLHATYIPGEANRMADSLSRQVSTPSSPPYRCTGTQLGEGPAQVCVSPSEPHCTDSVQSQGGQGTDSLGGPVLAQQNLVLGPGDPGISPSLAHSSEEGPPLSGEGHNLAPAPRSLEPPPMVPGRDQEDFRDLSPSVVNTLLQARAPSTRQLYDLKWRIFENWCSPQGKDPRRCGIESVLSFLQGGLDRHLSASTLKIGGETRFDNQVPKGARRLNPPWPHLIFSRDLAVVLQGLQQDLFEPLQSVKLDALSLKMALLTALTSFKRVGDLQALSVNSSCLEFGPADSHSVPCAFTWNKLSPSDVLNSSLSVMEDSRRGKLSPNKRISHWLVDAIRTAYQARGLPCPPGVRAHSTRGVAASAALANGASLTDICRTAGWATPNTFARFYNLRMEPVSARVLNGSS
ncbi:hypothetical protein H4Q32_029973 [Labeo rohita]|uniref:Reverse transcriptase RNase H-like domain-containing protein n=1 Tax=Labeo rohita TaxID=84645 RepID=A0ABQ8KZB3_LABRO|nr:hypothetical protein H4Q32_029973 [Labeo rohita]